MDGGAAYLRRMALPQSTPHRWRRILAIALAVTALAATGPVSAQPRSATGAERSQPSAAVAPRVGLHTGNRAAVNRAYLRHFARYRSTRIGWTGRNAGCRAGRPSARAHAATLDSLNFVRALGGLAPVEWNKTLSAKAQKAALIMSANNSLNHFPPRSWKCWTRAGSQAAGNSNLALSYPAITAGGLVEQYMDDEGSFNTVVGHRRWIMYPPTTRMGSGTTATSNALWVLGPTGRANPNPAWVGWPTAGWFPAPLEPNGRWSLSSGSDATDFSNAHVSVVRKATGQRLRVRAYTVVVGYGKPTLVWHTTGLRATGAYRVTVRGIADPSRASRFARGYTVRLFAPRR